MSHPLIRSSLAATCLTLAGCSLFQEDSSYDPAIDPAQFVRGVDNPFFPLVPGTTRRYRSTGDEDGEETVVTVMPDTKVIAGVTCTVVHDVVREGNEVKEDTWDWFAQDRDGNVWYFGEDTKEYEHGRVSTAGSWQAGVNGAKPGIVMPAHPTVGRTFRQEYLAGEAEDEAQIVAVDATVTVPAGTFSGCVQTKDWTRLEPGAVEHKYYAPGVGCVAEVAAGGRGRVELVSR